MVMMMVMIRDDDDDDERKNDCVDVGVVNGAAVEWWRQRLNTPALLHSNCHWHSCPGCLVFTSLGLLEAPFARSKSECMSSYG